MAESTVTSPEMEEEEHEEGEISDEEPPPLSNNEEQSVESPVVEEKDESHLDVSVELGSNSELRAAEPAAGKLSDLYRGRGELDSNVEEEIGKKNGRVKGSGSITSEEKQQQPWPLQQQQPLREFSPGVYGATLYNFAWAQAVSGRPSFPRAAGAESPSNDSSPKVSSDGVLLSGSPGLGMGLGTWSMENRKLSRDVSRDLEMYRRTGRSSEERDEDNMSPLRDNAVSRGGLSERLDPGWGRRIRENRAERSLRTVRSRGEKAERGVAEGEDVRMKNQRSESRSPNGRHDEGENGGKNSSRSQKDEENGEAEEKEEGELEEGEIELPVGSLSTQAPASPSKAPSDSSRPSKYNWTKTQDYRPKEKSYARSLSSKSHVRLQVDEYSSRRYRESKPQEPQRDKRLFLADDLVKNVAVRDAQKSFVDVCTRLQKALRVLDELRSEQPGQLEGRQDSPLSEITVVARQTFAGIRAVYAVRNTAKGREQERDKDIFPRLLGLASGQCKKLFTPKQRRELDEMMRDVSGKGQYSRDLIPSGPKKNKDNFSQKGDSLVSSAESLQLPVKSELKSNTENGIVGRIGGGFVDPRQAEEAAAIAAAALAYAQSSASARATSLYGSAVENRATGAPVAGKMSWGWLADHPSQAQFIGSGFNGVQANTLYNPSVGKYQLEPRPSKSGEDGHLAHTVEARGFVTPVTGSSPADASNDDLISRSGYLKTSNSYGMLEEDWEELSPPGAGISSYLPTASVQASGVRDSSSGSKVWPMRQEIRAVPPYQKNRGASATSLYSIKRLPSPTRAKSGVVMSAYSGDQLPSPTHPSRHVSQYSADQLPSPTHPHGRGAPVPAYTAPPPAYSAQPPGYNSQPPVYSGPPTAYNGDRLPSPSHQKNLATGPVYSLERLPGSALQKSSGAFPQYLADQVPIQALPKSRVPAPIYSVAERLPSPTPDESEDVLDVPVVTKPVLLDAERIKNLGRLTQGASTLLNIPEQHLSRSQSLDAPVPKSEQRVGAESTVEVVTSPPYSKSVDGTELAKSSYSFPPKAIIRSRDPRRRLQNHSLDLTDVVGMDLNSHLSSVSSWNQEDGHLSGMERTRKRLASDAEDMQDGGMKKRQKGQRDSSVEASDIIIDDLHAPSGTGGWLDDNVISSFAVSDESEFAMEIDEEVQTTVVDSTMRVGPDVMINEEDNPDVSQGLSNNGGVSKSQIMDVGQSEGSQRRMKPRDPRRARLDTRPETESCSNDLPIVTVTATSSTVETVSLARSTTESPHRSNVESAQTPKQAIASPKIGPHHMEKLSSLVVGSSSVTAPVSQSQQLVQSGGAHAVQGAGTTKLSVGFASQHVEASLSSGEVSIMEDADVVSESISLALPEYQKDKSMANSGGSRKLKGNPSQWGASPLHPGLKQLLEDFSEEERLSVQLERKRRMEEQDRMFSSRKLCLVLDLDHTLLNSAKFSEIEAEWEQRLRAAESLERNRSGRDGLERRELYRFPHMSMWTKLRPGIWKFLARASQIYELHVYTMGNKVYATEMAKLLDPTGKLFAGRVISKGDDGDGDDLLPKSKDLDGVLGMESAVVIIDDSARVWPHHSHNLIVVERYMYFPCSRRQFGLAGPSLLEVGHDERESDGMLASALSVIDRIHQRFFQNVRLNEIDVREILAAQQRQVLAGCKVVFSRVFPVGEAEPHRHPLWRSAEQFGAICTIALDEQVTHVVAISLGTDKVNWAIESGRHVVRPAWLEASTILYRRANERDFPVVQLL